MRSGHVLRCFQVCLLLLTIDVLACGQQQPDLSQASLEELMNIEVYSASKHAQKISEAPAFITIVNAEDIRRYGYRSLGDILRSVPGFYVTYDRNYSYLGIRGFSRPGDYNTRVLLLVDGHRINDAIYDCAPIGQEFPLDVDLIERVEVIRGPGSSLYGANAFFGVINVITRHGKDVGVETSAEGAAFGTYKGRFTYGRDFGGWGMLLSGSFYQSEGQTLYYPEYASPLSNHGIARGMDYESYRNLLVNVSHGHFTFQGLYGTREKRIPTGAFQTAFNDPRDHTVDERAYIDMRYERELGKWLLSGRAYVDHYAYDAGYPWDLPTEAGPVRILNIDSGLGRWWGSELKLSRTVLARHLLTGGMEFRDNLQQDQSNYDVQPYTFYLNNRGSSLVWAGYLQDEWALTRRLTLNAGVRYDHYDVFGGRTHPRLALIFQPRERTIVKVLYGSAFRAPNTFELHFASWNSKANPELVPETIRSAEVMVEQWLGRSLRIAGSVYHSRISDLISQRLDPADRLLVFENREHVAADGVEIQLDGKLSSGLEGRLSYSYQEGEDSSTNLGLSNSPRHLAQLNLGVPLLKRRLFAGLESQYMSKRLTLRGNTVGGHTLFNFTLLARNLGRRADLSASVYNLFDKRFADPGAGEHLEDALQQDGRSFRVKVSFHF